MSLQSKVKQFLSGMITDVDSAYSKEDSYVFALNAALTSSDGDIPCVCSEPSAVKAVSNFPVNKKIIGSLTLSDKRVVLFLYDPNFEHEIGIYDPVKETYSLFTKGACLKFSDKHPIKALEKVVASCERLVYFTDKVNEYRVINISNPSYQKMSPDKTVDCPSIQFSRPFSVPSITLNLVEGGNLKVGAYSLFVRYLDSNKVPSVWVNYSPYIHVPYSLFKGSSSDTTDPEHFFGLSPYRLEIILDGLDTRFSYVQFAVVRRGNTSATAEVSISTPFEIPATHIPLINRVYYYNGEEERISSIEEVLQDFLKVHVVEAHTTADNRLILGNIKEKTYNYSALQRYASRIKVEWIVRSAYEARDEEFRIAPYVPKGQNPVTLMRDEVYAFAIQYIFSDGSRSEPFHIPGRPQINNSSDQYGFNEYIKEVKDDWDIAPLDGVPRWKKINTYTSYTENVFPNDSTSIPNKGLMGYYEVNTTYPKVEPCDNHPDGHYGRDFLGNLITTSTRIRHHRVPDFALETDAYPQSSNEGSRAGVWAIHPVFTLSGPYPDPDIVGHVFLMGDRKTSKTILDKGVIFPYIYIPDFDNHSKVYYGGLVGIDLRNPSTVVSANHMFSEDTTKRHFAFVSPRSLFRDSPPAAREMKLEGVYLRKFDNPSENGMHAVTQRTSIPPTFDSNLYIVSLAYSFFRPNERPLPQREYVITDIDFLPPKSFVNQGKYSIENATSSFVYAIRLNEDFQKTASGPDSNYFFKEAFHHFGAGDLVNYLTANPSSARLIKVSLKNFTDIFTNLQSIIYRPLNGEVYRYSPSTSVSSVVGGDTFIEYINLTELSYISNHDITNVWSSSLPNAKKLSVLITNTSFFLETSNNYSYRLSFKDPSQSNYYTRELPSNVDAKKSLLNFVRYRTHLLGADNFSVKPILHEKAFSFDHLLTDKAFFNTFSKCPTCNSLQPTRIYYSHKSVPDLITDIWREIPVANSTEVPFIDSSIRELSSSSNELIAYSDIEAYYSPLSERLLTTSSSTVFLGGESLFQSWMKINGTARSFTDVLETPFGILNVDLTNRAVYLGKEVLSLIGMSRFFSSALQFDIEKRISPYPIYSTYHPYGIGISLGYDPYYQRLLITKKDFDIRPFFLSQFKISNVPSNQGLVYYRGDFYANGIKLTQFNNAFFVDKSFTVSFNLPFKVFDSFHSYTPRHYFNDYAYLYSNDIYRHHHHTYGRFYEENYPFKLDVNFPAYPSRAITFASFMTDAYKLNYDPLGNRIDKGEPIDLAVVYSDQHSSFLRKVIYPEEPFISSDNTSVEATKIDNAYRMAAFRDLTVTPLVPLFEYPYPLDKEPFSPNADYNKSMAELSRIKGTFIGIKLISNNYPDKIKIRNIVLNFNNIPR